MYVLTDVIVAQTGWTALHIAAREGHVKIVNLMLQCKRFTEVNAKDRRVSQTAFRYVME